MEGRLPIKKGTICSGINCGTSIDYLEKGREMVEKLKKKESVYKNEK